MNVASPNISKKPNVSSTQVVLSSHQSFILSRRSNESTDVICPFVKKDNNTYFTNFTLPLNQLYRAQMLYDMIPAVSRYTVADNIVNFDCVLSLPDEQFANCDSGYMHFVLVQKKQNTTKEIETYFDPKMVFKSIAVDKINPIAIDFYQKIKFKTDFLKAFPIILKSGFILSTVDKDICQLFITVNNPTERFIGDCSKFEVSNIIQYLMPLWSIFDIRINKNVKVSFREDFIKNLFENETHPIILHAAYELVKPNEITISKIGDYIPITE